MHCRHLLIAVLSLTAAVAAAAEHPWQQAEATVLPHGELRWAPTPAVDFDPATYAGAVRYIDYAHGDDANAGTSPDQAWRHHPWDWFATGNAATHSGPTAYIFKRGVWYRGQMKAQESGTAAAPIILTSLSSWGTGEAILAGSDTLPASWVAASSVAHPARLPEIDRVWALDLSAAGLRAIDDWYRPAGSDPDGPNALRFRSLALPFIGLWRIGSGDDITQLHVARSPDWQPGGDNFVLDYWHAWDGQKTLTDPETGTEYMVPYDSFLIGHDADAFVGGYGWFQYPSFMGTPKASPIPAEVSKNTLTEPYYNPEEGSFYQGGMGGLGAEVRYMLEHLPQFLDSADEFYLDTATMHLFYRPPDGVNPNDEHLELATDSGTLVLSDRSHIQISHLSFRFAADTTLSFAAHQDQTTTDIAIHHCRFRECMQFAISGSQNGNKDGDLTRRIRIADCDFRNIWETAIEIKEGSGSVLDQIDILRNRIHNTGMRHQGNVQSNVPAIDLRSDTGRIAGNILSRIFGSGIVVHGSRGGNSPTRAAWDEPLIRVLVHHNRIEDTALGLNDYGCLALWQSGVIYAYNNLLGNSVGHMPGGYRGKASPEQVRTMNVSYPLYLDGDFKQYCFNNILFERSVDPADPYVSSPGYFSVFGFMNDFCNNTIYNVSTANAGSSGARQNIHGNLYAGVSKKFFSHGHGSFSQLGGGDDNTTSAVGTLAYARNVFHGAAVAGDIALASKGAEEDIEADTIAAMQQQMANYGPQDLGIRVAHLGAQCSDLPIALPARGPIDDWGDEGVDCRPSGDSAAIDAGGTAFIPWALYGCVGEWHFTRDERTPAVVQDYSWYFSAAHIERSMYNYVPPALIAVDGVNEGDYIDSQSEDWVPGALRFDGTRAGRISDAALRADMQIPLAQYTQDGSKRDDVVAALADPANAWTVDEPSNGYDADGKPLYGSDDVARYPGSLRKTPAISTQNLLVEAIVRIDAGGVNQVIIGKYDGSAGYRLEIDGSGTPAFRIADGSDEDLLGGTAAINDGAWHHLLAEVDRSADACTITLYVDGLQDAQTTGRIGASDSIDTSADVWVGQDHAGARRLIGALDFLRICHGTLAQAQTDIAELYAWQQDGPCKYDFTGRAPVGRRDAGAIEQIGLKQATGLGASIDIANAAVRLSWTNHSTGATHLTLQRSTSPAFDEHLVEWQLTPEALGSFVDTTTVPGETYYYRVLVGDATSQAPPSRVLTVEWGTQAPPLPRIDGIRVVRSAGAIDLRWGIRDASDYPRLPRSWTVSWATTPGGPYQRAENLTEPAYRIAGIDPDRVYQVRVAAVNGGGTAQTQEFSVYDERSDFAGMHPGDVPSGWTANNCTIAIATPPDGVVSPSGTPLLNNPSGGNKSYLSATLSDQMQYHGLEVVFARHGGGGLTTMGLRLSATDDGSQGSDLNWSGEANDGELNALGTKIRVLPDAGEVASDLKIDPGEFWTLRMMTGPNRDDDPLLMDVYLQLRDQTGANRIDHSDGQIDAVINGWSVVRDVTRPGAGARGQYGLFLGWARSGEFWIDAIHAFPFNPAGTCDRRIRVRVDPADVELDIECSDGIRTILGPTEARFDQVDATFLQAIDFGLAPTAASG